MVYFNFLKWKEKRTEKWLCIINQCLYELSWKKKNKGPFYHMRLCRNNGISCFFGRLGGRGSAMGPWAYGKILVISLQRGRWVYPASELPRLAGACFLLLTLVLWTNPTLALPEWAQKPGLFLSYDPVFRNYSYKGTDHNNPIYPVFLASAMRNEETDKALWEPSLCVHLRLGPLLSNYLKPLGKRIVEAIA